MKFEELKNQMIDCKTLHELFSLWQQAHQCEDHFEETTVTEEITTKKGETFPGISKDSFVKDGYICEQEYKTAPKRILFILKEANIQAYRSEQQLKNPSDLKFLKKPDCA